MDATGNAPVKPHGLLKWAFTLPRYLYRWHLGWLMGHQCLMITHLGRKSGRRRQTVLEVVQYDPKTLESVVVAGYGVQSDWYRNIQAHPALLVQVGGRRYVPRQRILSFEETLALFEEYQQHHPSRFRRLLRLAGHQYDGTPERLRTLATLIPAIAFSPQEPISGDETDTAWS
jgi:deazaflavin-dependent oxidoreductase (nitroreductase family)